MSRQHTQYHSQSYSNFQNHLHNTHLALQNLTTHIRKIHTELIRISSEILDTRPDEQNIWQTENFGYARRHLNAPIQELVNTNHDLVDFWRHLVPFNTPPSPPRLRTLSLVDSETFRNLVNYPGLVEDHSEW